MAAGWPTEFSVGGSEESILRVRDVDTGQDRPESSLGHGPARWPGCPRDAVSTTHATRHPARCQPARSTTNAGSSCTAWAPSPVRIARIFGEGLGPSAWTSVLLSPDGRWLGIEVADGPSQTDLFLIDTSKRGTPSPIPVVTGRSALFNLVDVLDDRLYVVSNEDAPHYRLWQSIRANPSARIGSKSLPRARTRSSGSRRWGESWPRST